MLSFQGFQTSSSPAVNSFVSFQIRKRGEDTALFSLSEEKKVIHGLDELVYFYKNNVHSGLQHRLTDHVPGHECPLVFKLHGSENLLHRATANGNYEVSANWFFSGTAKFLGVFWGNIFPGFFF